jgi:hypothetical protein
MRATPALSVISRHSSPNFFCAYSLAANPEQGVQQTSRWAGNSENTIRKHYLRLIKPAQGRAWFEVKSIAKASLADLGLTEADFITVERNDSNHS